MLQVSSVAIPPMWTILPKCRIRIRVIGWQLFKRGTTSKQFVLGNQPRSNFSKPCAAWRRWLRRKGLFPLIVSTCSPSFWKSIQFYISTRWKRSRLLQGFFFFFFWRRVHLAVHEKPTSMQIGRFASVVWPESRDLGHGWRWMLQKFTPFPRNTKPLKASWNGYKRL